MREEELILIVDDFYSWFPDYSAKIDYLCDCYNTDIYTAHKILTEQD